MHRAVVGALRTIQGNFASDELAFLALTSKIELPFRDRLAFAMAVAAGAKRGRVAREYRRTDIALLEDGRASALVEIKACYSFDLIDQAHRFVSYVTADLEKARRCGRGRCACFGILLAVHPRSAIPSGIFDTIKYARRVNAKVKENGSPAVVKVVATKQAEKHLSSFELLYRFDWRLGEYLGIGADLMGWVVAPFPQDVA